MNKDTKVRRVTFEVSADTKQLLDNYIGWGMGVKVWQVIADDLICALSDEDTRETILALIINGKLKLRDYSRLLNEEIR